MNAPDWLRPLAAAPFVGSFLSVLVTRLPQDRTIVWGRSACRACGHGLGARDLVPLLSWAVLRGRCRYFRMTVGFLYPGMELGALAVAAAVPRRSPAAPAAAADHPARASPASATDSP